MDKKTLKLFLKTEKETKAVIDRRRNKHIISNKTDAVQFKNVLWCKIK